MTEGGRGRVLLVHRYFEPDTPPYATILSGVARALAADGFEVSVLTGQPSYNRSAVGHAPKNENVAGVRVRRFAVLDDRRSAVRKVVNLLWFCGRLVGSVREFRRADLVMAATTPPVLVALVCLCLARVAGARFVYHKQDVWPEVAEFQGGSAGFGPRVLRRVDAWTERQSAAVVVLSEDMARTVVERGTPRSAIYVINNFDPWPLAEDRPEFIEDGVLDIVFAGNLGAFQGIEALIELVGLTAGQRDIHWHFFGDGALRESIEKLVPAGGVTYYGHRPAAEVADFVASRADLGVVSLNPGVIRAAYPSKTMTYLRNGCPLLALVEEDSELAVMVRDRELGVVGGIDAVQAVAVRLNQLAERPAELLTARTRAHAAYKTQFSTERQLLAWISLMRGIVAER